MLSETAIAAIVFALPLAQLGGRQAGWQSSRGSMANQRSGNAARSGPSAVFQPEVARLHAEGLELKEAFEASLDGNARHLAAIFQRKKPKEPSEAFEFRIIESDSHAATTIFRRTEFFFTFASGEMAALNGTDMNGDGLKEILVQSSSGGNCWSCNPTEVYRVRNHKAELIAAGPVQKVADLNGDGIPELLVTDTRWEIYEDLSHVTSPWATIVYAWRDGRYVNASRDYPSFYKGEIDRLRRSLDQAKEHITRDDFSDDSYIGSSISLAITYAHMGEAERGLKELETLLGSNARSPQQSKRRVAIIRDFRSGESAKKLQSIKYQDPIL